MKVGPFFKWFGSKWSNAKKYPYPIHSKIIEPFAGSAGYSCNHSQKQIFLWEADPNLIELWKWLIVEATPNLIREIPVNLNIGLDIRKIGLSKGQELLLKHWQRTNNVGDCWTISPWGNMPGQWTLNTRSRIADQIKAISHWKFQDPYTYLIDEIATWFIDPPYQFNYKYRKGITPIHYDRFNSLIQTINSQSMVIVCEAIGKNGEIPSYLPFEKSHKQVTSRRKTTQSHHSTELIYIRP